MNKVALNIGNLTITWYAIFILTGIIVAYLLIKRESKKYNISGEFVSNLVFWCVIFGILGARIYYVLFNLDYYMERKLKLQILRNFLYIYHLLEIPFLLFGIEYGVQEMRKLKNVIAILIGILMADYEWLKKKL